MLTGLRIFDLSIVTAGAGCTQMLADHGAEVIKIESPGRPDLFRGWSGVTAGADDLASAPFRTVNRNKRSLGLDLKNPAGLEVARRLIATCDVVVENFRQGVLDRLGLGFEQLVEIRPDIVLVSISSQGTTGPNVAYGSFGSVLDALGGTMSVTGYDAETPLWSSYNVNYPDQTVAMLGPALIVQGVLAARATGEPQWIDVSQREVVTSLLTEQILDRSLGGADPVPTANGGLCGLEWASSCAGDDEWIVLSVFDADDRHSLGVVVGLPGAASAADEDLRDAVALWSRQRSKRRAAEILQEAGIAAAPVMKSFELHDDPYFSQIGFFQTVDLPGHGTELQRGWIVRFDDVRGGEIHGRAPHIGEHTVEILTEIVSASPAEINHLLACGAVVTAPASVPTDE